MLNALTNAPRTVAALSFGLLALSALAAVSHPVLPERQTTTCAAGDATTTCSDGKTWEKLICDDPIKVTKCVDAKTTCASWNVCDCCSPSTNQGSNPSSPLHDLTRPDVLHQ